MKIGLDLTGIQSRIKFTPLVSKCEQNIFCKYEEKSYSNLDSEQCEYAGQCDSKKFF